MDEKKFLEFLTDYINKNEKEVKDIVDNYFNSESLSINVKAYKEMLPQILLSLLSFINNSSYVPNSIKERVTKNENDQIALKNELVYIYLHAAIPLLVTWEKAPADFRRKILVPLRYNLSDIMYAFLSTTRSLLSEMVYIESNDCAFVSNVEYDENDERTYLASDYAAYAIYELNNPRVAYGYLEAWLFDIKLNYIRLLDDKMAKEPLVLIDANGYGIFEGNMENVINSIDNPMYQTRDNVKAKDMLGVDFSLTNIEELQENLQENFYLTQYHYEANFKD